MRGSLWAGLVCAVGVLVGAEAQTAVKPVAEVQKPVSCSRRLAPLTDAEAALSRREFKLAAELFSQGKDAASRAGGIRVLLAEDKQNEAEAQATAWVTAEPKNAVALEAQGEVLYRGGHLEEAHDMALRAHYLDTCLARVHLLEGRYANITADFATSTRQIELAHRLDDQNPDILFAWMSTLPRKQRLEVLNKIAKDTRLLNDKARERVAARVEDALKTAPRYCTLANGVQETTIPMVPIMDGPVTVKSRALDVFFNGKRRRLEIDTGASGLTLSRSAAGGLGLAREGTVESGGIGDSGNVKSTIAYAAVVKVGNLEFHDCEVTILEKSSALSIDGLIGGDVFRRSLVTLDFPKEQLRLQPLPVRPGDHIAAEPAAMSKGQTAGDAEEENEVSKPRDRYIAPEMKDWTPIYKSGTDILIPVQLNGTRPRLFLMDTGADLMAITPDAARTISKVHDSPFVQLSGISGKVTKVYEAENFTIDFAKVRLPVRGMSAFDMTNVSHDEGTEISGMLGAEVLNRLTVEVDYRDNLVRFTHKAK